MSTKYTLPNTGNMLVNFALYGCEFNNSNTKNIFKDSYITSQKQ